MSSRRSHPCCLLLPFWLLAAAWFCANAPQAVLPSVITWLREAEHFSHQARLRHEVAALLSAPQVPVQAEVAASESGKPVRALPVVEAAPLEKLTLALVATVIALIARVTVSGWSAVVGRLRSAPVGDVPYPPPRDTVWSAVVRNFPFNFLNSFRESFIFHPSFFHSVCLRRGPCGPDCSRNRRHRTRSRHRAWSLA